MDTLTLHIGNKNYSSWSLRPWLALKQTGAPFTENLIPLNQPATRAALDTQSPSGRVPVLCHGALRIWESLAICEYLAEIFPGAGLWPAERAARATARAVATEMHAGFATLRQQLPMDIRATRSVPHRVALAAGDIARISALWRDCIERFGRAGANGAGPFLFGGWCIADAMFAPVATRFHTYAVPLDPVAATYVSAQREWPAMREWRDAAEREAWSIAYDFSGTTPY